jgi:uncharacterized membrane protein
VYERAGDGLAKASAAAPTETPPEFEDSAKNSTQANVVGSQKNQSSQPTTQAASTTPTTSSEAIDPIPDTPVAAAPPPEMKPVAIAPPPPPAKVEPAKPMVTTASTTAEGLSASIAGNSNYRRMLYMGLILLIAGAAFFLTRPASKKKFDMLDATTAETSTGRSKLSKDNHDLFVG